MSFKSYTNLFSYNFQFEQDAILIPKETSLFGYYEEGSWSTVFPAQKVTSVPEIDNKSLYAIFRTTKLMYVWNRVNRPTNIYAFPVSDVIMSCEVQTKLYIEDWIGLRTLDKAGKVKFITLPGKHLEISSSDMRKYVLPYLKDKETTATLETMDTSPVQSSFLIWSSIKKAIGVSQKLEELRKALSNEEPHRIKE